MFVQQKKWHDVVTTMTVTAFDTDSHSGFKEDIEGDLEDKRGFEQSTFEGSSQKHEVALPVCSG